MAGRGDSGVRGSPVGGEGENSGQRVIAGRRLSGGKGFGSGVVVPGKVGILLIFLSSPYSTG